MTLSTQELAAQFAKLFADASMASLKSEPPAATATPVTGSEAAPPAAPAPPEPFQTVDYASKGYHVSITVAPDQVVRAAALLDKNGFGLDAITGVDWIAEGQMEVVYDFFHPSDPLRVAVRTRVPRDKPKLPSIWRTFAGANWHERETHDFFGIRFVGHPDLTPLLLPEDADFHPLKKDFSP